MRSPPMRVFMTTTPACSVTARPITHRLTPKRLTLQHLHRTLALTRRHESQEAALVGDVERVETEDLAHSLHVRAGRAGGSPRSASPTPLLLAISFSDDDTPPRVGSRSM